MSCLVTSIITVSKKIYGFIVKYHSVFHLKRMAWMLHLCREALWNWFKKSEANVHVSIWFFICMYAEYRH